MVVSNFVGVGQFSGAGLGFSKSWPYASLFSDFLVGTSCDLPFIISWAKVAFLFFCFVPAVIGSALMFAQVISEVHPSRKILCFS